jgi:hypothetical protein
LYHQILTAFLRAECAQQLFHKTSVKVGGESLTVKMLTNEHELNHAVAVHGVPVAGKVGLVEHHLAQLISGSCGIPQSALSELLLHTGLLKEIRHVGVLAEIYQAFCSDDVFLPFFGDKIVEFVDIERSAAIIYKGLYAILFGFALIVVVVVMMVVVTVFVFVLIVVIIVIIIVVVMMVVMVSFFLFFICGATFKLIDPCCRGGYAAKVEQSGIDNLLNINVCIVAVNDLSLGLYGADYSLDACGVGGTHLRNLIEQDDVAELNLLYDEVLNVFFVKPFALQAIAASKLALHAQSVNNSDNAIELGKVFEVTEFQAQLRH